MTHTIILTAETMKRTKQALNETHALLAKELSYSADLQHQDRVSFYRSHIQKLNQYINDGFISNQVPN